MIFTVNPITYTIAGTKGDSGVISFKFNRDMDGSTACFVVKEKITTPDDESYIHEEFTFPATSAASGDNDTFLVTFSPETTIDIPIVTDQDPPKYDDFIWGLKVYKGTTYAETAIPLSGGSYPKFRLYYNISECNGQVV